MTSVNIYLNFNGNCMEAFEFYKAAFGGEFSYIGKFKDIPPSENNKMKPEDAEKIMHIGLHISKETALMGSDVGGEWAPTYTQGNNFSVSINTDSKAEADRLFGTLSNQGQVTMPMNQTFWGDYFGMFIDQFGINWMVSFNEAQQQQSGN